MDTSTTPSTRYYFGPFELDPRTGELWKSGRPVKLPPQPTKLLVFLASQRGELVTREEIKESLWGANTFVDFEQGLNFCIKKIRSALGDNPDQPEFIQTLPRRGYRFIALVQYQARNQGRKEEITDKDVSVSHSSRPWPKLLPAVALIALVILTVSYALHRHFQSVEQQHPKRIMLVVLPFQSMSDEPRQQYFSDGMTEELITQLGRMNPDRLGVIAPASAEQYKRIPKSVQQIGKDLGVEYVIEGSARTDGTRVRITAQLIQVRDQTHLWAKEYDRELRDILVLQNDVARDAAKEISIELSARSRVQISPHALNPVAYEAYLQGRYYWNQRNEVAERKALAYFQQAVAIDPDYAAAYDQHGGGMGLLLHPSPDRAIEQYRHVLVLDPNFTYAKFCLGLAYEQKAPMVRSSLVGRGRY